MIRKLIYYKNKLYFAGKNNINCLKRFKNKKYFFGGVTISLALFILVLVNKASYNIILASISEVNSSYEITIKKNVTWLKNSNYDNILTLKYKDTLKYNAYDKKSMNEIIKFYENHPWVEKVISAKKDYSGKIRLALKLRKPSAIVEHNNMYSIVDKNGYCMISNVGRRDIYKYNLPVIVGSDVNICRSGVYIKGLKLVAALNIINKINNSDIAGKVNINVINVKNIGKKYIQGVSEIVLWTTNDVEIQWGRTENIGNYIEPSDRHKIQNIKNVLNACKGLEGLKILKVQYHKPIVVLTQNSY